MGSNEMVCELSSGCKNDVYGKLKYCALHCSDGEIESKDMDDYLQEFSKVFMNYLYENILNNKFYKVGKNREITPDYEINEFKYENIIDNKLLTEKLSTMNIVIENILFPKSSNLDNFILNARTVINYLGKVDFKNCRFGHLYFNGIKNYYHKYCTFSEGIEIHPSPQVRTKDNKGSIEYRYVDCIFEGNIALTPSIFTDEIHCNMFYHCFFKSNILISNLKFKKTLFKFPDILQVIKNKEAIDVNFSSKKEFDRIKYCYKIKKLSIIDCSFESDFKLNGISKEYCQRIENAGYEIDNDILHISNLDTIDTKFKAKVEIKYRNIDNLKFTNSNVDKVFDTFQSKFVQAKFSKSIFNDFAGFEEVEFGVIDNKNDIQFLTVFEHVTFLDFSSFRGANFRSGLDFSKTNLKDKPNFLNVEISRVNTNRETFRIIKNSFDDTGNNIEANKFFIEEMKAYREEVNKNSRNSNKYIFIDKVLIILKKIFNKFTNENFYRKFIINANYYISGFGESYIKPTFWLIFSLIIYTLVLYIHGLYFDYFDYFIWSGVEWFWIFLNNMAMNLLPFSKFLEKKSGIEFISLLFYIWFGILIWQVVVAVKRHTQR
ncbi:hypothetical protein [Psychrobacter arcticus]|nr:hypothetical protein [Psychrobacter arcticus]